MYTYIYMYEYSVYKVDYSGAAAPKKLRVNSQYQKC